MKTPTINRLLLCISLCIANIMPSLAQEIEFQKFSGKVIDSEGKAISAVNIYIPGVPRGTISDKQGKFAIMAKDKETIYCSHMGMKKTELQLDKNQSSGLIIRMEPEPYNLHEITIVRNRYTMCDTTDVFEDDTYNFEIIEQNAEFPGKAKRLEKYLTEALQYPEEAFLKGEEGQVTVEFTITKRGTVKNPKIVKGVSPALDEEAIRIIRDMPNWKPAIQRSRPVETRQRLSINFAIIIDYEYAHKKRI